MAQIYYIFATPKGLSVEVIEENVIQHELIMEPTEEGKTLVQYKEDEETITQYIIDMNYETLLRKVVTFKSGIIDGMVKKLNEIKK